MSRLCDISAQAMRKPRGSARPSVGRRGARPITTHLADVSDEAQFERFPRRNCRASTTSTVSSFVQQCRHRARQPVTAPLNMGRRRSTSAGRRLPGTRIFPCRLLLKSRCGSTSSNTSSVNGFWGSLWAGVSHTAYIAAKFAVKGFTEALIGDLRLNAPHSMFRW